MLIFHLQKYCPNFDEMGFHTKTFQVIDGFEVLTVVAIFWDIMLCSLVIANTSSMKQALHAGFLLG
jgi:hypothetical protein